MSDKDWEQMTVEEKLDTLWDDVRQLSELVRRGFWEFGETQKLANETAKRLDELRTGAPTGGEDSPPRSAG